MEFALLPVFLRFVRRWGSIADFQISFRSVSCLSAVSLWHPDGFNALAIGKGNEITDSPVIGREFLFNLRQANAVTLTCELVAEIHRQGRDGLQLSQALAINGLIELPGPVRGLAETLNNPCKLLKRKAQ